MADLTRFNFHALRFMESEWVQQMTAAEVGQYVLLLCKAWLLGKDTSLPDNPGLLATWARTNKVADIVLDRFPVVQTPHGNRRRNEALYREWQDNHARIIMTTEAGKVGGATTSEAKAEAARRNGLLGGRPSQNNPSEPNETQALYHTIPDKIISVAAGGQGDFKTMRLRYRKAFGIPLAGHQKAHEDYARACGQYGEETVLKMFEEWAPDNQWIRDKRYNYGLKQFYEGLQEQIDAHVEETPVENVNLAEVEAIVEAQHAEAVAALIEVQEKEAEALAKVDQWL